MPIQLQTDRNIPHNAGREHHVDDVIRKTLLPYRDHVTRVEVHISDVNAKKASENDKRCVVEYHLSGLQPMVVTAEADTVHHVLDIAAKTLRHAVASAHEKEQGPPHVVLH